MLPAPMPALRATFPRFAGEGEDVCKCERLSPG
jgi:hypothetical protein